MKPMEFAEQNCIYAKDQKEYLPLPAFRSENGEVVSCWRLDLREKIKILFSGRIWLRQLTFGEALQPQSPTVDYPFIETENDK